MSDPIQLRCALKSILAEYAPDVDADDHAKRLVARLEGLPLEDVGLEVHDHLYTYTPLGARDHDSPAQRALQDHYRGCCADRMARAWLIETACSPFQAWCRLVTIEDLDGYEADRYLREHHDLETSFSGEWPEGVASA